jgi:DNA-binding beta-propeller fold protein YncE
MRRLVVVALAFALAFTFVGTRATRAATVASSWPVGAAPFGLALDGSTGKVYVANSASLIYDINNPSAPARGLISVVDPASGSVGRILTSLTSNFVVADSAGRRLYSSNSTYSASQESLDVFDLDSAARVATISGAGGLMPALDAPASRLFVGGHALTVVDTSSNTVVMSMAAPAGVWFGVAVDPQLHRLYLTDASSTNPRLFVFDDRDLSPVGQVVLGSTVRYAIAVDQTRHLVFLAGTDPSNASAATLYVIDGNTLAIVHTTAIGGFPLGITFAPARGRVYVSTVGSGSSGGEIDGIDDTTFEVAETMRIFQFRPGVPLMLPDGRLYIGNYNDLGDPAWNPPQDSTLFAIDLNNHAPVFQSLTVSPSTAFTGDVLRADASAIDPDFSASLAGDPVTYTYGWSRNGTPIVGATSSTLDLSVAGNGDRGDAISVRVTASDGSLSSDASTSVVISDSPPTASVTLNTSAPVTNAVLGASVTATDPDNDPLTYRFAWRVNGAVRQTSSGQTASDSLDLGLPGNGDHGDNIVVELVASDGTLDSPVATAGATVVNSAPTVAVSLDSTTPATKSVLVATVVGQDVDRDGLSYVYAWLLNGVVKRTVTTASTTDRYDLAVRGNGDKGDVVTLTVTASDGSLTSPSATISATVRNK